MDKKDTIQNHPSLEGLKAELQHANRVLQTALREVRESRLEIEKKDACIHRLKKTVSQQSEEALEWMHAAAAHKTMVQGLQTSMQSPVIYTKAYAEAVLQISTEDPRFRSTNLLAMALEELCKA